MKRLIWSAMVVFAGVVCLPSVVSAQGASENAKERVQNQVGQEAGGVNPRSQNAREHMSVVAQKVEEILATQGAQGGIGEKVREIAKEQKQAQETIKEGLDKIEAKQGLMKKIFGPDYGEINKLWMEVERNRVRIRELTELKNQVNNEAEETQLEEMIQALNEQNTSLEEQARGEENTVSIFGWLSKLLTG